MAGYETQHSRGHATDSHVKRPSGTPGFSQQGDPDPSSIQQEPEYMLESKIFTLSLIIQKIKLDR